MDFFGGVSETSRRNHFGIHDGSAPAFKVGLARRKLFGSCSGRALSATVRQFGIGGGAFTLDDERRIFCVARTGDRRWNGLLLFGSGNSSGLCGRLPEMRLCTFLRAPASLRGLATVSGLVLDKIIDKANG